MINKTQYLIYLLILILLASCSFDDKTGVWSGSKEEKRKISELEKEQGSKISTKTWYSSENIFSKEISVTKNIVLTEPQRNLSWKMSGLNLQNFTGNILLSNIDNNFLKKKIGKNKFSIAKILASPLIFKDYIIFADDTGTIFCINKNGKIIWKKNIYKKIYKKIYKILSFSIHLNKIYVADNIGFVYAVSLENGQLIWIKNYGIPFKSNLKIFDNKIFIINQDNRLFCLDMKAGTKIWDIRTVSSFIKSQNFLALAISKNGYLAALNSSGDLLNVNAKNGRVIWSLNTTGSLLAHDTDFWKSSDIIMDDNNIIFSTPSSIFSYRLDKGYFNWKQNINTKNTPIIDGNNVFVVSDNGYFVNLDKNSGEIIFSTNILKVLKKRKQLTEISGYIMGSGKIYTTTTNGHLIVSSATSGKVEYFRKIGDPITASPIISHGSLYILTENSRIFGFN